jgi:hypothetical protein
VAKLVLTMALLLLPAIAEAWGYVFAQPKRVAATQRGASRARPAACDASYPTICVPAGASDLDCGEIGYANFTVVGSDPHGFDNDGDGIGCETLPRQ